MDKILVLLKYLLFVFIWTGDVLFWEQRKQLKEMIFFMAKMKYWNGITWEILDAKDADTLDGKHAETALTTTEKNDLAGAINEVKSSVDVHKADGAQHAKTARFVIGTSTADWTAKDCDYLCNGIDDQEEINNAIAALPASGGEIVILDGTYNITAKINVNKNNVSIRGNGNATVLKRMWNSSSPEGVITLTSAEGCRVQNLQIDGNKDNYSSVNNNGIYLYSSSDNTITDNTCNNNTNNGISLYSSSNNTVTGNTCNNNYYGIYLYSSSNNTITDSTCNNNDYGIRLYSSSNNNTVTGNTCNNNYYGIYLYSSSNNTITDSTCNNNDYRGIYLYSSSNNNTVTGNTCNNNYYGIYLYSSSNNTITGNTCNNNNNNDGISLYASSSNNTITGNTCNNNNYGIHLDSSSNNTIIGNTCIRGTGQPSDYTSAQYTILLSGSSNNCNLISLNNCMGKAVVVNGGTGNIVWGNKFDATNDLS